ncbi:GNAT acetyltransferase-like protein [Kitasatospora viridis]|uniref:GNAT acetyltransferase-like protein n=1 Tax=Kitasatospora viridis TaxID=281105 RepID=A0A561TVU0_9ACTN|nr:GNAT acetyltransferase-like protein [Kitasatospora viridis]
MHWSLPERPGFDAMDAHVRTSGIGGRLTDRPTYPRAEAIHCAGHRLLRGDPRRLDPARLAALAHGQFTAPERFLPLLGRAFAQVSPWERTISVQRYRPHRPRAPQGFRVRPMTCGDARQLAALVPSLRWITETWGGAHGLAASGRAWGAFTDGNQLAAVACTYWEGRAHEDVAVLTLPSFRQLGLGLACVSGLSSAVRARGRVPTWSAPRGNEASQALARAAGFRPVRTEVCYYVGRARAGAGEPVECFTTARSA